jgi:hypothetical protein
MAKKKQEILFSGFKDIYIYIYLSIYLFITPQTQKTKNYIKYDVYIQLNFEFPILNLHCWKIKHVVQ